MRSRSGAAPGRQPALAVSGDGEAELLSVVRRAQQHAERDGTRPFGPRHVLLAAAETPHHYGWDPIDALVVTDALRLRPADRSGAACALYRAMWRSADEFAAARGRPGWSIGAHSLVIAALTVPGAHLAALATRRRALLAQTRLRAGVGTRADRWVAALSLRSMRDDNTHPGLLGRRWRVRLQHLLIQTVVTARRRAVEQRYGLVTVLITALCLPGILFREAMRALCARLTRVALAYSRPMMTFGLPAAIGPSSRTHVPLIVELVPAATCLLMGLTGFLALSLRAQLGEIVSPSLSYVQLGQELSGHDIRGSPLLFALLFVDSASEHWAVRWFLLATLACWLPPFSAVQAFGRWVPVPSILRRVARPFWVLLSAPLRVADVLRVESVPAHVVVVTFYATLLAGGLRSVVVTLL